MTPRARRDNPDHASEKKKRNIVSHPPFFSFYSCTYLVPIWDPPVTMRELRPNQRPLNDRPGIIGIIWPVVYSSFGSSLAPSLVPANCLDAGFHVGLA